MPKEPFCLKDVETAADILQSIVSEYGEKLTIPVVRALTLLLLEGSG